MPWTDLSPLRAARAGAVSFRGAGLDENPVYLRICSGVFHRGGLAALMSLPPELGRSAGRFAGQIGPLPVLLLLAPYLCLLREAPPIGSPKFYLILAGRGLTDIAYVMGALLLYARAVEGGGGTLARNFLRNGRSAAWGEALWLTPLSPADYGRGLVSGVLHREALSLLLRLVFLAAVIAPVTLVWSLAFRIHNPFFPFVPEPPSWDAAVRMTRFAALVGVAAYAEIMILSALNLAGFARGAAVRFESDERGRRRGLRAALAGLRVPQFLYLPGLLLLAHLPGAFAYLLWTMNSIHRGRRLEAGAFGLSDMTGLYIFVIANIPLAWVLARAVLRSHQPGLGAMVQRALRPADVAPREA